MRTTPIDKVVPGVLLRTVDVRLAEHGGVSVCRRPVQRDAGTLGNDATADLDLARSDAPIHDERVVDTKHFVDRAIERRAVLSAAAHLRLYVDVPCDVVDDHPERPGHGAQIAGRPVAQDGHGLGFGQDAATAGNGRIFDEGLHQLGGHVQVG